MGAQRQVAMLMREAILLDLYATRETKYIPYPRQFQVELVGNSDETRPLVWTTLCAIKDTDFSIIVEAHSEQNRIHINHFDTIDKSTNEFKSMMQVINECIEKFRNANIMTFEITTSDTQKIEAQESSNS